MGIGLGISHIPGPIFMPKGRIRSSLAAFVPFLAGVIPV